MRVVEIILVVIFCIGAFFKINHYPGGSILLIISLGNLSLLYSYFSFILLNGIKGRKMFKKSSYEGIPAWRLLMTIILGFGIGVLMLGVLFKVQMYPGFSIMMKIGFMGTIISLTVFVVKYFTSSDAFVRSNLRRLIPIVLIGTFFYTITADDIIDYNWGAGSEYATLKKELLRNPENQEARERFDALNNERSR